MIDLLLIIVSVAGGFGLLFWFLNKQIGQKLTVFGQTVKEATNQDKSLSLLSRHVEGLSRRVETTSQTMQNVARELGTMSEIGRDMKKLQDFFQTPKLRGNIGEQVLRDLVEQILPKSAYRWQYKFRSNQTMVDVALKTSQGMIPIDAKFPVSGFAKRTVKKHIDDIAKKYILPGEGTVDFAVMYLPSESVYYELFSDYPELVEYAYQQRVYLVSPNTFYYFLKIILVGLEGAKIEQASRLILQGLKSIQQEGDKTRRDFEVLSRHLGNAKNAGDRLGNQFERLQSQIDNVSLHALETDTDKRLS